MEKLNFKQRMKQTLTILLVFAMIFTTVNLPAYAAGDEIKSGTCGTNAEWSLSSDGILTISGSGAMASYDKPANVPWAGDRSNIKEVSIKSGVTTIGSYAFYDLDLIESIIIPDSVMKIEEKAFASTNRLQKIYFLGNPIIEGTNSTLGSTGDTTDRITLYFEDTADQVKEYCVKKYGSVYTAGGYASLTFDKKLQTVEYGSYSSENLPNLVYTATFDGLLLVKETTDWSKVFSIKGYDKDGQQILSDKVFVKNSVDSNAKTFTATLTPQQGLNVGTYTFKITANAEKTEKEVDAITLEVTPKTKEDETVAEEKTISNKGGSVDFLLPSLETDMKYDTAKNVVVEATSQSAADQAAAAMVQTSPNIAKNEDGTYTLTLNTNDMAEGSRSAASSFKLKIPVTGNYTYHKMLTVNVKPSPAADFLEKASITATDTAISITPGENTLTTGETYEYAVKESVEATYAENSWKKAALNGEITLTDCKSGTSYILGVRYAATEAQDGKEAIAATLPIEKEVKTLPAAPEVTDIENNDENGFRINYQNETVIVNGAKYEIYIPDEGETAEPGTQPSADKLAASGKGTVSITNAINGGKKLYIRQKSDGTDPAGVWATINLADRADIPDAITDKALMVSDKKIQINPTISGCEYLLVPGSIGANTFTTVLWEQAKTVGAVQTANGGTLTFEKAYSSNSSSNLSADSQYTILVRRPATAEDGQTKNFASATVIKPVTTKKAQNPSSGSGGGGNSVPKTDVTTSGKADERVTSSPTEVKNETKTDAAGNTVTTMKVTVSSANQKEILRQAKANKSGEIVIKVANTSVKENAKLELALDKSFIDSIVKDTNAKLTVQMPDGKKTLSRAELEQLSKSASGNTVTVDLAATDEPQQPTDSADKNAKTIKGVQKTAITLKSAKAKKGILLTWTKKKGYKVDYFEIYRSTKKNSGYGKKPFFRTKDGNVTKYLNTKNVKTGKKYYYKVRGVRMIESKKHYTKYSNKTWKTAK